jgi:hypothetical protein
MGTKGLLSECYFPHLRARSRHHRSSKADPPPRAGSRDVTVAWAIDTIVQTSLHAAALICQCPCQVRAGPDFRVNLCDRISGTKIKEIVEDRRQDRYFRRRRDQDRLRQGGLDQGGDQLHQVTSCRSLRSVTSTTVSQRFKIRHRRHRVHMPAGPRAARDDFDARENVGNEIASLVGFGISPIRNLIVRRTVDVVEDRPRQSPSCHQAEIPDVVASIDTHWLLHLCELYANRSKSCAWAVSVEATREAAVLLFHSVYVTVCTICRISFICAQARIETE